jgi:AraC-like DNA-binding protein
MPHVLVVDDHAGTRDTSGVLLRLAGFRVSCTSNGTAALNACAREPVDLVLMDLRLGEESGLDVLRAIKNAGYQMPVVVTTAFPDCYAERNAQRYGAVGFVDGPFIGDEVVATVRKYLGCTRSDVAAVPGSSHGTNAGTRSAPRLAAVVREVCVDPAKGSLKQLAPTAALSESRLRHLFVSMFGISFSGFVSAIRMHSAARMLRSSKQSIRTIASACGIDDSRHFRHKFTTWFGVSPNRYRHQYRAYTVGQGQLPEATAGKVCDPSLPHP